MTSPTWRSRAASPSTSRATNIPKLYGRTDGLKASSIHALERLYRRRVPPTRLTSPELARALTEISHNIHRQVGALIDRRGAVKSVLVGDANGVEIPDLARVRGGGGRLVGVRLIHTHLRGEPLSRDDLTDLSVLRLDLIAAIEVLPDGLPGRVMAAHLVAPNPNGKQWELLDYPTVHDLDLDPEQLLPGLEADFGRSLADVGAGERAIIVGVSTGASDFAAESMAEAQELARTAGLVVVDTVVQRRRQVDPRFVLGKGRMSDLVIRSKQLGADLIIFDRSLSASQIRNIAELTDQKIVDRTQLILDIFAQHARTREGRIQVELAQLKYLLPRLSGRGTAMSRLAGGIGARGPGESKLETDRRRIRSRISLMERQLRSLTRGRAERRKLRNRERLPIVSIVGYTNAGKSTLLNRLTGSSVLVEDKLFATLDPTTRRLRFPEERDIILTDTVGFIRDLPKDLIDAFRATLEELTDADLLLHAVDPVSPVAEEHMEAVDGVLRQLGLVDTPTLHVFTKSDLVSSDVVARLVDEYHGVAVSAVTGHGMEALVEQLRARVRDIGVDAT